MEEEEERNTAENNNNKAHTEEAVDIKLVKNNKKKEFISIHCFHRHTHIPLLMTLLTSSRPYFFLFVFLYFFLVCFHTLLCHVENGNFAFYNISANIDSVFYIFVCSFFRYFHFYVLLHLI